MEAEIDAVLDDVKANGITADELKRTKAKLIANLVYARDNQANLARAFGTALTTGMTVDDVLEWPDRIEAVKVEDVKAAAAKVLDIRRSVTGILLPASGHRWAAVSRSRRPSSNSSQQ